MIHDKLEEVIICSKCMREHNIYTYDEEGEFPCVCGQWLEFKRSSDEPDYDAEAKEDVSRET